LKEKKSAFLEFIMSGKNCCARAAWTVIPLQAGTYSDVGVDSRGE